MINKEHGKNDRGAYNVEDRYDRVTKGFVGALRVRLLSAQDKDARDRQDIEDKRGRDNVVEQVAVKVTVPSYVTRGIRLDRARQD